MQHLEVSRGLGVVEREVLLELARGWLQPQPFATAGGGSRGLFREADYLCDGHQRTSIRRAVNQLARKGLVEVAYQSRERGLRRSDGDVVTTTRRVMTVRLPLVRPDAGVPALPAEVVEHFEGIEEAIRRVSDAERAWLEEDANYLRSTRVLLESLKDTERDFERVLGYHGPRLARLLAREAPGWEHVFARWAAHVAWEATHAGSS